MRTLAFGLEQAKFPSWRWVGHDISKELSKYFEIKTFNRFSKVPEADIVVVVKHNCKDEFVQKIKEQKSKLIYCPIDFYQTHEELDSDATFIKQCDMILVHCERLIPILKKYNDNIHFVEHHNKYGLPEMAGYKENGFILWIGSFNYITYLMHWLKKNPIENEIRILTDADNPKAKSTIDFCKNKAGIDCYTWSEKLQYEMMSECKAAIDIKRTSRFNQNLKPPTKAQKYISSGIPFAVNAESYSSEYFSNRGFEVATPDNTSKWFSPEYWEETKKFGEKLKICTSLENVGLRYKELIDKL